MRQDFATRTHGSPLLLTGRTEHLQQFAHRLSDVKSNVFVLRGRMGTKQRRAAMEALSHVPEGERRVILATGSYIGEGFDDSRLDTLFLAMPVSWKGTLQQYVGRLHRLHDGKKEVRVYDYVDSLVPMLARMYKKRLAGYQAIGYSVARASNPVDAVSIDALVDTETVNSGMEKKRGFKPLMFSRLPRRISGGVMRIPFDSVFGFKLSGWLHAVDAIRTRSHF